MFDKRSQNGIKGDWTVLLLRLFPATEDSMFPETNLLADGMLIIREGHF